MLSSYIPSTLATSGELSAMFLLYALMSAVRLASSVMALITAGGEPMAPASLGQVHAARLHSGEEVVVKVQYPGIDKTVESDVWQLRKRFDRTGFIGRRSEADLIVGELRERLKEELDYVQEITNLADLRSRQLCRCRRDGERRSCARDRNPERL